MSTSTNYLMPVCTENLVRVDDNRPFIAFRSLSDIAGADPDQNQKDVFEKLASKNSAMVVKAFIKELP